jgi:2-amino-4-hydroxy-6-hydroxymethyldihydropteridine diphosphokinase
MGARIAVGLGSNLGPLERNLLDAASALERVPGLTPRALSSAYLTEPVGPPQPAFLNAVLLAETTLPPLEVLAALQGVEAALGRRRGSGHGPRVIDLDLLLAADGVVATQRLTLPHPRLRERAFALVPLVEVWPGARDPVCGGRYADLLAGLGRSGVGPARPLPLRVARRRVDHTADLGFEVSAANVEILFERAAMALVDTMARRGLVRERERRLVEAKGDDEGELLVGLLSEVVFLVDARRFVPRRASVLVVEAGRARMALYGERLHDALQLRSAVKAVTHHGPGVQRVTKGRYRATIVMDV